MGVQFKIFCGCGAFPAAEPVISAARPCSDAQGRDRKSAMALHARLATVSLRAFDRDTGTFSLTVDTDAEPEPVTVTFLPSEYISARPSGLAEFEEFLRTARPGTPLTFVGRWVIRSWESRSGELREVREFEATRLAEGHHDHAVLCGPWPDGPLSCPALAARQRLEAQLPSTACTPAAPPPCTTPTPPPATPSDWAAIRALANAPTRVPSIRTPRPADPNPWSPARLLGLAPRPRLILSEPRAPSASLSPCARAAGDTPVEPCRKPGCCTPDIA